MSQEKPDPLMERNVAPDQRPRAASIGCPMRGCDGIMYTLKPGEHLSRRPRAGWTTESRLLECPKCEHRRTITVQVRAS